MALLVDTGILYALADRDDAWHLRARALIEPNRELLLAPASVLPEVTYLMRERLGPDIELAFVASVAAAELAIESLVDADYHRSAELMAAYPEIGFVDASIVAIAERLGFSKLATTDRRLFAAVRPRHASAFTLVP